MSPKEKAKELFFKYSQEVRGLFYRKSRIKRCALIAVDEIFFALKYNLDGASSGSIKYWTQVKQEIENL